ncbi:MAG TPA: 2Fe-2S iron-sulfur cluster-binding protein, partial [Pirellulales bacterium]|nr:2Fe-2S iron-sulfur cluster-binding protein [Pirellulales bacterium]
MGIVLVDGREVSVGDHERLNGIQAAERAGVEIPHYCWHAGLTVVASCRMCLVESGTKNPDTGAISMMPKLVPACQTPAKDGTVFVTDSENVRKARAMVEEDLLIDHPIDCPICDKAGECRLQDYHFEHGQNERRADIRPFTSRRRDMGDTVTLFVDRCVMCTRCVRFTREISGTSELMVINRGSHEEIDVLAGFPLDNKLSGNVVDLCPVGALGDKDFLYQQRVWFLKQHAGVCTGCSTGCSITVEENQDHVWRLKPRENPHVNKWWMCDDGRYGYHHVHSPARQVGLRKLEDEVYANIEWAALPAELQASLVAVGRLAAVLSPHLTVEEAYLLAKYIRGIDAGAVISVGPVPVVGEEETFKNGFTIRAEKAPNRRGVEEVVKHFGGHMKFEELLATLDGGEIRAAWVTGGYPSAWHDAELAERFSDLDVLVVQDMFDSPLWNRATYQVPGGSFAERDGSYVNHADRLQHARWAVRPPTGAWVEGPLYWRLLQRPGMYNSRKVLDEIAAEIPYFAVAADEIPETGVDLKINQLAAAQT